MELFNRKFEIELLSRRLDHKLEFNPDRLYFADIRDAWHKEDMLDLSENLIIEISCKDFTLITNKDNELKRVVTELHNKRKAVKLANDLMNNIGSHEKLVDLIRGFDLDNTKQTVKVDNHKIAQEVLQKTFDIADGKIKAALQTGTAIDTIDGGLRNEYILVAARPSVGKSVLGLQMAINVAKEGKRVAFFSLEMSKYALIERFMYNLAGVNANNAKNNQLTQEQRDKLTKAVKYIQKLPIDIIEDKCDVFEIVEMCKSHSYEFVVIDYLQRIKPHRNADRRIVVEEISLELADLPKDIKCPVVVISSLSRPGDKNENKPPSMIELKETGNLEFDADQIYLLHRTKEKGIYSQEADVVCTKNRNGQTGYIKMKMYGGVYAFK